METVRQQPVETWLYYYHTIYFIYTMIELNVIRMEINPIDQSRWSTTVSSSTFIAWQHKNTSCRQPAKSWGRGNHSPNQLAHSLAGEQLKIHFPLHSIPLSLPYCVSILFWLEHAQQISAIPLQTKISSFVNWPAPISRCGSTEGS